jgi:hypothetical protein
MKYGTAESAEPAGRGRFRREERVVRMIEIGNRRLRVRMQQPGEIYSGARFDWNGFITDVTLDGRHVFCADESLVPGAGSGGRGLCNEFGIKDPVGYDDAGIGEGFPKLGVGILERTGSEDYDFFKPYPVTAFESEVETTGAAAVFRVKSAECRGYSAYYEKKISLYGECLAISYRLVNTGSMRIDTTEYCHNFVNINGKTIGPDYELRFSFIPEGDSVPDIFDVNGNVIRWRANAESEFYWAPGGNYSKTSRDFWELTDTKSGVGMREECHFPLHGTAIWGKAHVVSPEMFIRIQLEPGEEMAWKRVYTFFS